MGTEQKKCDDLTDTNVYKMATSPFWAQSHLGTEINTIQYCLELANACKIPFNIKFHLTSTTPLSRSLFLANFTPEANTIFLHTLNSRTK